MIQMPQMAHMFVATIKHPSKEIETTLAQQISGCVIDYAKKTITLTIDQPVMGGALHELLYELFNSPRQQYIVFEGMNGSGKAQYVIRYEVTPSDHKFNVDYATPSEVATHTVVFDINAAYAIDPPENEE